MFLSKKYRRIIRRQIFLYRYQTKNVFADNHQNEVNNPDNVPSEKNTQNACNNLTFHDSGNRAAY